MYEGENNAAEISQSLTGQLEKGYTLNSNGNKLFLRFRSDDSETAKGFKIRYEGILIGVIQIFSVV